MMKSNAAHWNDIQQLGIKDAKTSVSILSAITKVQNAFGPIDFSLKMSKNARLGEGALACCSMKDNTITLSKEYFGMSSYDTIETAITRTIKNQFHPETRMKVSSIVIHELCHAVWNIIEKKGHPLKEEVSAIMERWIKYMEDQHKSAFMAYAGANVFEFWAEMLTQSLCGTPDEFTEEVMSLAVKCMID